MKRHLALLLLAISILILVSCGGGTEAVVSEVAPDNNDSGGDGGSDNGGNSGDTNQSPTITGSPASADEGVSYSFTPVFSDSDGDALTLTVQNVPAWLSFNASTGELSGTPQAGDVGGVTNIIVTVSDGVLSDTLSISFSVIANPLEAAIRSGNVAPITAAPLLLDGLIATIEDNRTQFDSVVTQLFGLSANGATNGQSLTNISWDPTHDGAVLRSSFGNNVPVLTTNAVTNESYDIQSLPMGIAGSTTDDTRYMVLGSNPMRNAYRNADSVNEEMHQLLENSLAWLTGRSDLKTSPFNVVLAQFSQSFYFPDQVATRNWLDEQFAGMANYNDALNCNGVNLAGCLSAETELLIISQVLFNDDDADAIAALVNEAMASGTPVLYLHHDGNNGALAQSLFPLFDVVYAGDNYWRRLQIEGLNGADAHNSVLPSDVQLVADMIEHFKSDSFTADLSACDDKSCPADSTYYSEFKDAAAIVQLLMADLDEQKVDVFAEENFRYQKMLVLLGDFFRQGVSYPMDKDSTARIDFLQSMFADHAVYNFRNLNPAQTDMGNFSRSDFSHITPTSKTVQFTSKPNFKAAGVYALPGTTFTVTRLDDSDVQTKVFINTLRSGATHEFETDGYKRPKFLQSAWIEIEPGETISLTSSYGGPIQISFDQRDLPVSMQFSNIGLHPYWSGQEDNATFAAAVFADEYDWAEIVTPGFQVHSKIEKMGETIANDKWGSATAVAAATERYMHNFPHVLAGFQGPGIDVVPEIHDFAANNGLDIETLDQVKHMNADQANCGYGCSGNPYDAYWFYDPTGHGDVHELGHGLERHRFRFAGFEGHTVTNPYSYFTKTQYFKDTGDSAGVGCQSLPFEELFNMLQTSANEDDPFAYMQAQGLNRWNHGVSITIQMMMSAQAEGVLDDGWYFLPRLHIIDREFNLADNNDEAWLAKREGLGFSGLTRTEAMALDNNDWLLIAISHILGRDMRDYNTMWGLGFSATADAVVAAMGHPVMPTNYFVSGPQDYCLGLNKSSLPVDGAQVWPL